MSDDPRQADASRRPQVSILTPFFNASAFFEEAVESVLAQTYLDWELLLIDDGSSDGSTAIALDYVKRYPGRIFYFAHAGHENRGTSAALNVGIARARGMFLALIDADDVWLPDKLAEQVPLLEEYSEAGHVATATLCSGTAGPENPTDAKRDVVPPLGAPLDRVSYPPDILIRCLQQTAAVPCPCSVLLRTEIVKRVGGFEEQFRVTFSDQAFYTKMFAAAGVYIADAVWAKYRIHPNSAIAIAKQSGAVRQERGRYLDFVVRYLEEQGLTHGRLWRAARVARWKHAHPGLAGAVVRGRRGGQRLRAKASGAISQSWRQRLRRVAHPVGGPRFGNLRRVTPLSRHFGMERGQPLDRHYIERFLARNSDAIAGRVLEIGDDTYTRRFGGERVAVRDVLHVAEGNPHATIVDDLASGHLIPSNAFDCVILTQTLHLIYDVRAAVATLHRILKPGGIVLATVPGISQIHGGRWKSVWYWSFTPAAVRRLFAEHFPTADLQVRSHGNVLAASAFLFGLAGEELSLEELDANDPLYPVIVTVRARKPAG